MTPRSYIAATVTLAIPPGLCGIVHDDVIKWKLFPRYWPFGPGEFPAQRPVTRSFDVFFDLRPNKGLSKQSWGWWFEMQSSPLWRHCNVLRGGILGRPDKSYIVCVLNLFRHEILILCINICYTFIYIYIYIYQMSIVGALTILQNA